MHRRSIIRKTKGLHKADNACEVLYLIKALFLLCCLLFLLRKCLYALNHKNNGKQNQQDA